MEFEVDESVWGGRVPLMITAARDARTGADADDIAPFFVWRGPHSVL